MFATKIEKSCKNTHLIRLRVAEREAIRLLSAFKRGQASREEAKEACSRAGQIKALCKRLGYLD